MAEATPPVIQNMIFYLSGFAPQQFYEKGIEAGINNYLYSFHLWKNINKEVGIKDISNRVEKGQNIFIDSGGYTARVKGVKIDVREYAKFLKYNSELITVAANLDTNDIEETLFNEKYLMSEVPNVKVIPIYHYSDFTHPKYKGIIDEYVEKYDYIGVGGVAGTAVNHRILNKFLSYVFARTRNKVRVHGFGMTGRKLVNKYPFYSVDSTSWQEGMRFGGSVAPNGTKIRYKTGQGILQAGVSREILNQNYKERLVYELQFWKKFEKEITELWTIRGVTW